MWSIFHFRHYIKAVCSLSHQGLNMFFSSSGMRGLIVNCTYRERNDKFTLFSTDSFQSRSFEALDNQLQDMFPLQKYNRKTISWNSWNLEIIYWISNTLHIHILHHKPIWLFLNYVVRWSLLNWNYLIPIKEI